MAIYDYLPRFHQLEPNNLKALQPGFVVSQMEVSEDCTQVVTNTVMGTKHMENGVIVTFVDAEGIVDVANEDDVLFINYTEPLNTIIDSPKFYAVNLAEENPRLVQLIPGDEWMTDIDYLTPGTTAAPNIYYNANLVGRIVKVDEESAMSNDDWFKVTTMADGTPAFHYLFVK